MRVKIKKISVLLGRKSYYLISSAAVVIIYLGTYRDHVVTVPGQHYLCRIIQVIDGDTVEAVCDDFCDETMEIRLQYIDAPEMSQTTWGQESANQLQNIVNMHDNRVHIQFQGRDVYQRHLGVLFASGYSVNLMMVEDGMARVYRRYKPPVDYIKAMSSAQQRGVGIWRSQGLQQNPQRYRRLM